MRLPIFRDFLIDTPQGFFVGDHVIAWLVDGIAPSVERPSQKLCRVHTCVSLCWPFLSSELIPAQYIWIGTVLYGVCIFFVKLSILLQYLQMFAPLNSRNGLYWTSHALIWTNLVFYLIGSFVVLFGCKPIAKAWDPLIINGHCINTLAANVASGTINSLSDLVILVLPQVSIWRLQMALRRKIQISALFLIGLLLV